MPKVISKEFVAGENWNSGLIGLRPAQSPNFDCLQGITVAHDLIEHFDNDESLNAEMQAFGTAIWNRFQGGYWSAFTQSFIPPEHHWENDFFNCFVSFCERESLTELKEPKFKQDDFCYDLLFSVDEMLRCAKKYIKHSMGYEYFKNEFDCITEFHNKLNIFLERCKPWMIKGFLRADKLYGKYINPAALTELFYEVEMKIDEKLKHSDFEIGDKLKISINLDERKIKYKHKPLYDY